MNKELTLKLVERFPVLYQDFYSPMQQTCMCWGFEHGDGWFDIIWQLSLAIEEELAYSELQKKMFLGKKSLAKKWNDLIYRFSPVVHDKTELRGTGKAGDPYHRVVIEKAKPRFAWMKKLVWFPHTGLAVQQVKEKFGTLRYYSPDTPRIRDFIRLAERLSAVTCEVCGASGKVRGGSWLRTTCDKHEKSNG